MSRTIYILHHSHTDIGYTDLQENAVDFQIGHIRDVLRILRDPQNDKFRWNCETLYILERFFEEASKAEQEEFFTLAKEGKIGVSASFLNFTDLADSAILSRRIRSLLSPLRDRGIPTRCAMCADINGISMGYRDALLENGVEFLSLGMNQTHGKCPQGKNQTAFRWESRSGRSMLVWNGEHYNLGNALGLVPEPVQSAFSKSYFGENPYTDPVEYLHHHLVKYLSQLEEQGYPYDFVITAVSGVFTDNAPPNAAILRTIEAYHARYGKEHTLRMVTLDELYREISGALCNVSVYRGDMTDWWANGIGSTPYAVKHYREAQRALRTVDRLFEETQAAHPALLRTAEDGLLLYAEHTWGHSASVSDPSDSMALRLDLRKQSYAARAHEAAALLQNRARRALSADSIMRAYTPAGRLHALYEGDAAAELPVEWEIETPNCPNITVHNAEGKALPTQQRPSPRGVSVLFCDRFAPREHKRYTFAPTGESEARPAAADCPPALENEWFRIAWEEGAGFTSFYNKTLGCEMLASDLPFFLPFYERTPCENSIMEDRTKRGLHICGEQSVRAAAVLQSAVTREDGPVYRLVEYALALDGTTLCTLLVRFFHTLPRIEFTLRLFKTPDTAMESVCLPLELRLPGRVLHLRKGGAEAFRPGVDQLPGTCMEYSMTDDGILYTAGQTQIQILTPDTPLVTLEAPGYHEIRLCQNQPADNRRPVCSWIMNNLWETNFKLDLSGFGEFRYCLRQTQAVEPDTAFDDMAAQNDGIFVCLEPTQE